MTYYSNDELYRRGLTSEQIRAIRAREYDKSTLFEKAPMEILGYHSIHQRLDAHAEFRTNTDLIGFELELEHKENRPDVPFIRQSFGPLVNKLKTETDGSLSRDRGCELISVPLSQREWRFQYVNIYNALLRLGRAGYTSHDNPRCGLHFHLNKELTIERNVKGTIQRQTIRWLTDTDINAIEDTFFSHPSFWAKLSRRVEFNYCRVRRQTTYDTKHYALNRNRRGTLEIRIFRGTLKPLSFLAALESCYALAEYSKTNSSKTHKDFVDFVKSHGKEIDGRTVYSKYGIFCKYVEQRFEGKWEVEETITIAPPVQPTASTVELDPRIPRPTHAQATTEPTRRPVSELHTTYERRRERTRYARAQWEYLQNRCQYACNNTQFSEYQMRNGARLLSFNVEFQSAPAWVSRVIAQYGPVRVYMMIPNSYSAGLSAQATYRGRANRVININFTDPITGNILFRRSF